MGISAYFHHDPAELSDAEEAGVYHVFEAQEDGTAQLVETFWQADDYWREYKLLQGQKLAGAHAVVTIVESSLDPDEDMSDVAFARMVDLAAKTAQLHLSLPREQRGRIALHLHDQDLAPLPETLRHHGYGIYELYADGTSGGLTGPMDGSDYAMNFETVKSSALGRGQSFAGMATLIDSEGAGYDMENEFETEEEFYQYELAEDALYTKVLLLADAAITGAPLLLSEAPAAPQIEDTGPDLSI